MRRRGAGHEIKRPKVDVPTKTYPNARRKLNEILKLFSFIKVSEVTQVPENNGRPAFYHGIGMTITNSKFDNGRTISERTFYDKGGRLRYNSTFDIGPCKLIDAAWGRDHVSANPQIGDILIGVIEPNEKAGKGRPPKVLRSWSRHGKIILELSRIVEFGTAMQELDTRQLLRQTECDMIQQTAAAQAMRAYMGGGGGGAGGGGGGGGSSSSNPNEANSTDDFWMLVRLILWGNLRPFTVLHFLQTRTKCKEEPSVIEIAAASNIKISCSAYDFISGLAFKLEDPDIFNDFVNTFELPALDTSMSSTKSILPPLPPPPPSFLASSTFYEPLSIGDEIEVKFGQLENLKGVVVSCEHNLITVNPYEESKQALNIYEPLSIPRQHMVKINKNIPTSFQGSSATPTYGDGSGTPTYDMPASHDFGGGGASSPPYVPSSPIEEGQL